MAACHFAAIQLSEIIARKPLLVTISSERESAPCARQKAGFLELINDGYRGMRQNNAFGPDSRI